MDSDKELKAHFISDNAARVEDVASFNDALADEEVELIILESDISGDLVIERDIEIISDVTNKYQFESQLTLGTGEELIISLENLKVNSLIIDAGQGKVNIIESNINELDLKSIGENSLDVNGSDILTLTINTMSKGRINLGERTKVNNFIANGEIEVVGARYIQRAVINNEQVSLDRPPQEIDEEESEVENPKNVIEEDLYTVSFIIRDAEDNLLSDVTVIFADEEKLTEDGYVEFNDIEPGNYDYKIEKTGFRSIEGSFDITGYREFDLSLREELADGITEVTSLEELEAALINGNVDIIYIANDITGNITIRREITILGGNNSIDEIIIDADNSSIILEDLNVEFLNIKSAGHGSRGLYILGNSQVEEVFLTETNWVNIQIDGCQRLNICL